MSDPKDNDELETKIANLIIGWSIEVQNMPRGKTVSVWCMDDIMHLISTHVMRARIDELKNARGKKLSYFVRRFDELNNFTGVMVSPRKEAP